MNSVWFFSRRWIKIREGGGGGRVSALDQKLVHLHRPDRAAAELEGGVDRNKYNLQYAFKNQIGQ